MGSSAPLSAIRSLTLIAASGLATTLAGCATPQFQSVADSEKVGPKVYDILYEVQCEVAQSIKTYPELFQQPDGQPDNAQYVVNISLTLDVTTNEGVNSSLAYVLPYSAATNFTGGVTPQLSGTQHRNFNETANLIFSRTMPLDPGCAGRAQQTGLKGDLSIGEIIATGTPYSTGFKLANGKLPYTIPALGVTTLTANDPLTNAAALMPSYGSTVDFTIIYGVGATPNWTLTHFVGPSPNGGALVSAMRTLKDTLVISIARVGSTAPASTTAAQAADRRADEVCAATGAPNHRALASASKPSVCLEAEARAQIAAQQISDEPQAAAARSAIDNSTRMILQRLVPP